MASAAPQAQAAPPMPPEIARVIDALARVLAERDDRGPSPGQGPP